MIGSKNRAVPRVLLIVGALMVGVVAGCGDEGDDAASSSSTTAPPVEEVVVGLVGCHQFSTNTGVDPEVALTYVPDEHEVYLDESGSARFALITKTCDDLVVDGVAKGPGHFNTAWIRIAGPDETRAFPDGVPTMGPTDYFVPILLQTDNEAFASATQALGLPTTLADEMTAGPPRAGTQTGSAVDTEMDPALDLRWSVEIGNERVEREGGIVHVLRGEATDGAPITYDIECVTSGGFFGNPATVSLASGSAFEDLLGAGFTSIGNHPDVDCTVTVTRD